MSERRKPGNRPRQAVIPDDWYAALMKRLDKRGVSFSQWVRQQILAELPKSAAAKLSPEPEMGNPEHKRKKK